MTSNSSSKECFVWIWLPEATEPVVAGKLMQTPQRYQFIYGQHYLKNPDAIPLFDEELPLQSGIQEKTYGIESLFGCLRDSAPDAWGRRVILNQLLGEKGSVADTAHLDEITYMLKSGSDRIGALDFQESSTHYQPRMGQAVKLEELLYSAELVEKGIPLSPALAQAMNHGTSIGGARPKVLIENNQKKYIAKFSSSTDSYNVIKAEYMAMTLARQCGLDVASVQLTQVSNKDVLLIERFDRIQQATGWSRRLMLSALTMLGLDEMTSRYASYEDLAEMIRHRFTHPRETLKELFGRIVFNILVSNTDDHARNHAAFWDGKQLTLTPAYDICPQLHYGREATQAMIITGHNRYSQLNTCLQAATQFMLNEGQARKLIDHQIHTIRQSVDSLCDEVQLSIVDRKLLKDYLLLPAYALEGYRTP